MTLLKEDHFHRGREVRAQTPALAPTLTREAGQVPGQVER